MLLPCRGEQIDLRKFPKEEPHKPCGELLFGSAKEGRLLTVSVSDVDGDFVFHDHGTSLSAGKFSLQVTVKKLQRIFNLFIYFFGCPFQMLVDIGNACSRQFCYLGLRVSFQHDQTADFSLGVRQKP